MRVLALLGVTGFALGYLAPLAIAAQDGSGSRALTPLTTPEIDFPQMRAPTPGKDREAAPGSARPAPGPVAAAAPQGVPDPPREPTTPQPSADPPPPAPVGDSYGPSPAPQADPNAGAPVTENDVGAAPQFDSQGGHEQQELDDLPPAAGASAVEVPAKASVAHVAAAAPRAVAAGSDEDAPGDPAPAEPAPDPAPESDPAPSNPGQVLDPNPVPIPEPTPAQPPAAPLTIGPNAPATVGTEPSLGVSSESHTAVPGATGSPAAPAQAVADAVGQALATTAVPTAGEPTGVVDPNPPAGATGRDASQAAAGFTVQQVAAGSAAAAGAPELEPSGDLPAETPSTPAGAATFTGGAGPIGAGSPSGIDAEAAAASPQLLDMALAPGPEPDSTDPASDPGAARGPPMALAGESDVWTITLDGGAARTITVRVSGASLLVDVNGTLYSRLLDGLSSLVITSTHGQDDTLVLDYSGGEITTAITFAGGDGTDTIRGPAVDITWTIDGPGAGTVGSLTFDGVENLTGAAGNEDTFVFTATGTLAGTVAGGDGGFDSVVLDGGVFERNVFTAASRDAGTIARDDDLITYVGMEPLTDNSSATTRVFTGTVVADFVLVYRSAPGMITIESDQEGLAGFESVTFADPTVSLEIDTGFNAGSQERIRVQHLGDIDFDLILHTGSQSRNEDGQDTIEFEGDILLNGHHLEAIAETITVKEDVTLSTSGSIQAGTIVFSGWYITLEANSQLMALGPDEEHSGDITILAEDIEAIFTPEVNVDIQDVSITVGTGAVVRGRDVMLTAKADNTHIICNPDGSTPADECVPIFGPIEPIIGPDSIVRIIEGYTQFLAVVVYSSAAAVIDVKDGTLITARNLTATATANSAAIAGILGGTTFVVGPVAGVTFSDAEIRMAGQVDVSEDVKLEATTDNTANVMSSPIAYYLAAAVATSVVQSTSRVHVTDDAVLTIGGNLEMNADTVDRTRLWARSSAGVTGVVAVAIGVAVEEGDADAWLDGTAVVGGNVTLRASQRKEPVHFAKLYVFPTVGAAVAATAGAGESTFGDYLEDIRASLMTQFYGAIGRFAVKIYNAVRGNPAANGQVAANKPPLAAGIAAAISISLSRNGSSARIGDGDEDGDGKNGKVVAGGSISVTATVEWDPHLTASSSAQRENGAPDPNGGGANEANWFNGSGAFGYALYENTSRATISDGAEVDAGGALQVKAETLVEWELEYGKNLLDAIANAPDVVTGFKDFITNFTTYLNDNLGLDENLFNSWSQAVAGGDTEVAVGGAIQIMQFDHVAEARIGAGAKVNQDASKQNAFQTVDVKAESASQIVGFGGNISLPIPFTTNNAKVRIDPVHPNLGTNTENGKAAVGFTFQLYDFHNDVKAEIADGALVYAASLAVVAETNVLSFDIGASGGKSNDVAFNGVFVVNLVDNETTARIGSGATVLVGNGVVAGDDAQGASVFVSATDETRVITLLGGIAISDHVGVGATAGLNYVDRVTEAELAAASLTAGGDARVHAENEGYVGAFAVSGAIATGTTTSPPAGAGVLPAVAGNAGGLSISGAVVANVVSGGAQAYVQGAGAVTLAGGELSVTAEDSTWIAAAAGSVALSFGSRGRPGTSAGIAGAVSVNYAGGSTAAFISGSGPVVADAVTIEAAGTEKVYAVSAAVAGAAGRSTDVLAGTVAINVIDGDSEAAIRDMPALTATTGGVELRASDSRSVYADAGSFAATLSLSARQAVSVGAAFATNIVDDDALATVERSTLNAAGGLAVSASSTPTIQSLALGIAASLSEQGSVGGLSFDLAGSAAVNTVTDSARARISAGQVGAGGEVSVDAVDDATVHAVAGAAALSVIGGTGAAVGASFAVNEVTNDVEATIENSQVGAGGQLTVSARSSAALKGYAIAGGGSVNPVSNPSGGGVFAGAGAVVVNKVADSAVAVIRDAAGTGITAGGAIGVRSSDDSTIESAAGAGAFGLTMSTSGGLAMEFGAAAIGNDIEWTVGSSVERSTISAGADVTIDAESGQSITAISVGIAGAIATGTSGGFAMAGAGSGSGNTIHGTTTATLDGGQLTTGGALSLSARDQAEIEADAGGVAIVLARGPPGAFAVGVSAAVNDVTSTVTARISGNVQISAPGGAALSASSDSSISAVTVAGGFSAAPPGGSTAAFSIDGAGAVSLNTLDSTVEALVEGGSLTLTGGALSVAAAGEGAVKADAGGVAIGLSLTSSGNFPISVAAAVAVNKLTGTARAAIADATVTATAGVALSAATRAGVDVIAFGIAGSIARNGLTTAIGGSVAVNDIADSADARITRSSVATSGAVSVSAADDSSITASAGAAAAAIAGGTGADLGLAVGVSVATNDIADDVHAVIEDSAIGSAGGPATTVTLSASTTAEIFALTFAGVAAGAGGGEGLGLAASGAGSGSGNTIGGTTEARLSTSQVFATGAVAVTAADGSKLEADAGSGALAAAGGGGPNAALAGGGAMAVNEITKTLGAKVAGSLVSTGGAVSVDAATTAEIDAVAIGLAGALGAGAAAGVALAGAGSGAGNTITNTVEASITAASIIATTGAASVTARDDSSIEADAGALGISIAGGASIGLGAAVGVSAAANKITGESATRAIVENSAIGSEPAPAGAVTVSAITHATIKALTFAGIGAAAGGGAGGIAGAGAGAGSGNTIDGASEARITASSVVTAPGAEIAVAAANTSTIDAQAGAGAAAGALGADGGAAITAGAAVALNTIGYSVRAVVNDAVVHAGGAVSVSARSDAAITAVAIGISAALSGGIYVGISLAGAGSGAVNQIATKAEALVENASDVTGGGAVAVTATDSARIGAVAGAVAAALSGAIGGASVAVGISYALNSIGATARAEISASTVASGAALDLSATSTGGIKLVAFAGDYAGSTAVAAGVGAAITKNSISSTTTALVSGSSATATGDVRVTARDEFEIAGKAVGGAVAASAGISVAVGVVTAENDLASTTTAAVENSELTSVTASVKVVAMSRGSIDSTPVAVGGSVSGGASLSGGGVNAINHISPATTAKITGSEVSSPFGQVDVTASSDPDITARIDAVTVAVALVGVAVGVSLADNEVGGAVSATIAGDSTITAGGGHVTVSATSTPTVDTTNTAVSASLDVLGAGVTAAKTEETIDPDVTATLTGGAVTAQGSVKVAASFSAQSSPATRGGSGGLIDLSLFFATAEIRGSTTATLGGDTTVMAQGLEVTASDSSVAAPTARSVGLGGVAGSGMRATATIARTTEASLGAGTISAGSAPVTVRATSHATATIDGLSLTGGSVAVSALVATSEISGTTRAFVADGTVVSGSSVDVTASATNTADTNTNGIAIGLAAGAGTRLEAEDTAKVLASIGSGAAVSVTGAVGVGATLGSTVNVEATNVGVSVLVSVGVVTAQANSRPRVEASLGQDATIVAGGDVTFDSTVRGTSTANALGVAASAGGAGSGIDVTADLVPTLAAFAFGGGAITGREVTFTSSFNKDASGNHRPTGDPSAYATGTAGTGGTVAGSSNNVSATSAPVITTYVGAGTRIEAAATFAVQSWAYVDARSEARSVTVSLLVGAGSVNATTEARGRIESYVNGDVIAHDVKIEADVDAGAAAYAEANGGSLGGQGSAGEARATVGRGGETMAAASLAGAVEAVGNVVVAAFVGTRAKAEMHAVQAAGVAAVSDVSATARAAPGVSAFIRDGAAVRSANGDISVFAEHNYNQAADDFIDANKVEATLGSLTVALDVSVDGQGSVTADANATVDAVVETNATLAAPHGAVTVAARSSDIAIAKVSSRSGATINVSGNTTPTATAGATTTARLAGSVVDSSAGDEAAGAINIRVFAQGQGFATATLESTNGGVTNVDDATTDAHARPHVNLDFGSGAAKLFASGNIDVSAIAETDADSATASSAGGLVSVNEFHSNAHVTPTILLGVLGGDIRAGGSISIKAAHEEVGDHTATASSHGSGGGGIQVDNGSAKAGGTVALAVTISESSITAGGISILAISQLKLEAKSIDDESGGIEIGDGDVDVTGTNDTSIEIEADALITAKTGDLLVRADNFNYALSDTYSADEGLGSGVDTDADATTNFTNNVKNNGILTAAGTVFVKARSTGDTEAKSSANAGGLGADADATARATINGATRAELAGRGQVYGTNIEVTAVVDLLRGKTRGESDADAGGGDSDAEGTTKVNSIAEVVLGALNPVPGAGAGAFATDAIKITAQHFQIDLTGGSDADCDCGAGDAHADGTANLETNSRVKARADYVMQARTLDVRAIAENVSVDAYADTSAAAIGDEESHESTEKHARREIFWAADVILLGQANPELEVDENGVITKIRNVVVHDELGNTYGENSVGQTIAGDRILVEDIAYAGTGQADPRQVTFIANSLPGSYPEGAIWGNAGSFTFQETWNSVRIVNSSAKRLEAGAIDVVNDQGTQGFIQIGVDHVYDNNSGAFPTDLDENTPNTTFDFDIRHTFGGTAVEIRNLQPGGIAGSNVVVRGSIVNPTGSVVIENQRGFILSGGDAQVERIVANRVELDADGGSVGCGTCGAGGTRLPITVELVQWRDEANAVHAPVLTAEASDNVILDLSAARRSGEFVGTAFDVAIESLRAGQNIDVVVNDSVEGLDTLGVGQITVLVFDPPSTTPSGDSGQYSSHFEPDHSNPNVSRLLRAFGDERRKLDSSYTVAEARAGGTVSICHVATSDRACSTTGSVTTVVGLEVDLDAAGQIFLTTNGDIDATEVSGDMLVGDIHSTAGDVALRSDQRILDGDGLPTIDVTGRLIGLDSGAGGLIGGVGLPGDFLEIDSGVVSPAFGSLRVDDRAGTATLGVFLTELEGDLRLRTVQTTGDVSLRTVGGSVRDALTTQAGTNVTGRNIDISANGAGANIGDEAGVNDLFIDSSCDACGEGDVALEATGSIRVTETAHQLTVVLAHAGTGDIRLTTLDTSNVDDEDIDLAGTGTGQLEEGAVRTVPHGRIAADAGSVELLAGDRVVSDEFSEIVAAGSIDISGDYGDADPGAGTVMLLRGQIIAGSIQIQGNGDADDFQLGDPGGVAGGTVQGSPGYVFLGGPTTIRGGGGDDSFVVYYLQSMDVAAGDTLTLDGEGGSDKYTVATTGSRGSARDYLINLSDTGAAGDGTDELEVYGADSAVSGVTDDVFVLRPGLVALLQAPGTELQRIDYGAGLDGLTVFGLGGDDAIQVVLGAGAPVVIDGGAGIDFLTVFGSDARDDLALEAARVAGAGGEVSFTNAEIAVVDALAGDDDVFVLSTGTGTFYVVIGGLGADTVNVGGDLAGQASHLLSDLQGPLLVEGDAVVGVAPITLPGEAALPPPGPEPGAPIDVVNVYDDASTAGGYGILGATSLIGLGSAGIAYGTVEVLNILLGSGDDVFHVAGTAAGTLTVVHGGGNTAGGGDYIAVTGGGGPGSPLVVYGDTSQDGAWYAGLPVSAGGRLFPGAQPFANFGNDAIDASTLFAGVAPGALPSIGFTAYGGAGDDIIAGSQAGDHLAGGSGNDAIFGGRGVDHIYGDSGVNLDIVTRELTIPTRNESTFPDADPLTAGDDLLLGEGPKTVTGGPAAVYDDVIFGDHGAVIQSVPKLASTARSTIVAIEAREPSTTGKDLIDGGPGNNSIVAGPGDTVITPPLPPAPLPPAPLPPAPVKGVGQVAPPPAPLTLRIGPAPSMSLKAAVRRKALAIRLNTGRKRARVTITAVAKVRDRRGRLRTIRVAARRFTFTGPARTVRVPLTAAGLKLLRARRSLRVRVTVVAVIQGRRKATVRTFVLRR